MENTKRNPCKRRGTIFAEVLIALTIISIFFGGRQIATQNFSGTSLAERESGDWARLTRIASAIRAQKATSGSFPININDIVGTQIDTLPTFVHGALGYVVVPEPAVFVGSNPSDPTTAASDKKGNKLLLTMKDLSGPGDLGSETLINRGTYYDLSETGTPLGLVEYPSKLKAGQMNLNFVTRTLRHQTNTTDVGWTRIDGNIGSATNDDNMVMLRIRGDLLVEDTGVLTTLARKKGLILLVDGDITVKGKISMTARGASAAGQNLTLFPGYPVSAGGGIGGISTQGSGYAGYKFGGAGGNAGGTGACGGGGAGTGATYDQSFWAGMGAAGTSYSGGSGGAGEYSGYANVDIHISGAGQPNGGQGGNAASSGCGEAGGGTGNPGGTNINARYGSQPGNTGTGGLLAVFSRGNINITTTGKIEANGVAGGLGYVAGGGGSGGGSVNVFYSGSLSNAGAITATGGTGGPGGNYCGGAACIGGAGGTGTTRQASIVIPASANRDLTESGGVYTLSPAADTLLDLINHASSGTFTGTKILQHNGIDIPTEMYEYEGNVVVGPLTYASITTELAEYANDVTINANTNLGAAAANTNMLMVRYNKNLTINSGVTLTTNVAKKGMFIYVNGNLTVNGTISMTARGANAAGQKLVLMKNNALGMILVEAVGGIGGAATYDNADPSPLAHGKRGNSGGSPGSTGACGGGGAGSALNYGRCGGPSPGGGAGGAGTSFSGGSGGGGAAICYSGLSVVTAATAGSSSGGPGGTAIVMNHPASCAGDSPVNRRWGLGGAGNNNTAGWNSWGNPSAPTAAGAASAVVGTGGLLVIYVRGTITIGATGKIVSFGSRGSKINHVHCGEGGSSGGGSINIFYGKDLVNNGTISAAGGGKAETGDPGGTYTSFGGDGTVRTQKVSSFY